MRDGEVLSSHVYLPDTVGTYPTILIMTPYGKFWYPLNGLPIIGNDIANSDYAFVTVDWRCFWGSIGACTLSNDNGEDGYDVVEWIAAQPWSDGQVGMIGASALANIQFATAREQPPHLVCAVPEVCGVNWLYEEYHPGGVLEAAAFQTLNGYYGNFGPVVNNPFYNLLWQITENATMYPEDIEIPMLQIGGWFDHNIMNNLYMFDSLRAASGSSVQDQHRLLIGPWVHGGSGQATLGGAQQGDLSFPGAEGWNDTLALRFFDHHMRGISNGWNNTSPITFFQMGSNTWDTTSTWPPSDVIDQTYFLQDDQSIISSPSSSAAFSYVYDPLDPCPTIGGKTLSLDLDQGPYDQSDSVETRSDVVLFTTPVLTQDLVVQGSIRVKLFVSSDRTDTDFMVRLTEVYPDGSSIQLLDMTQRMRFRNGYTTSDTAAMIPGQVEEINLKLDHIANTFKSGNRIRLIISSSNYPQYNRNMNTNGIMYPNSNPDTLVNPLVANNTIHVGGTTPSSIVLPIAPNPGTHVAGTEVDKELAVYPNPTSSNCFVTGTSANGVISILDPSGKVVKERRAQERITELSVSGITPGFYTIRVSDERSVRSVSLVIH